MPTRRFRSISPYLLCLLLLASSLGLGPACGKKAEKKSPSPAAASPLPLDELAAVTPSPGPTPGPKSSPTPQPLAASPAATALPLGTPAPGVATPQPESLPAESQASELLLMGDPIKTAEGTTLVLDKVNWSGVSSGAAFLWTVASGPSDKIRIEKPTELKARVTLGDLETPTEWLLRLQAKDGRNSVSGELKIQAFPAKLQFRSEVGGAWVGIKRMGDKWVAGRGQDIEIFGPDFRPLAKIPVHRPVTQFLAMADAQGKGSIFIQSPEGSWAVLQSDPVSGSKKTEFPQLGRSVRRWVPFELEGALYVFGLLERSIELWSLADPLHPKLKTSLGNFLKNPLYLAFAQRTIYVAEEDQIHLIDYPNGSLVASLPSGGSVTTLTTYQVDGKDHLLVAIGRDRTTQGRKDHGLRLFEILPGGRLGAEQRISLSDQAPVARALVIPGAGLALAVAEEAGSLSLRMIDLKQKQEIPLQGTAGQGLMAASELSTGRLGDQSVAVLSDGNQLRVLAFKPVGTPPTAYAVSSLKTIPSLLSAAWVKAQAEGLQVWVGDEGTASGGALARLSGGDFQVSEAWNAPAGSYPAHADFRTGGGLSPLLYLAQDAKALQKGSGEGLLGLIETGKAVGPELSKPLFGSRSPQATLRAAGIAGRSMETGLRLVTALSRLSGSGGNAGLAVLDKPVATAATAYLAEDLAKAMTLIPLPDARDVALSADGKVAFVAAGGHGVVAVDLEKKTPVARMSLGSEEWVADRVLLGQRGDSLVALFVNRGNRQVILKIFGIAENSQMQEFGSLAGLPAVNTVEGVRAPRPALTEDDLYLFLAIRPRVLGVFNLSNPVAPAKIAELEVNGEIRGVSLANRFKDVFLALGANGAAKLEFGF